TAIERAGAKLSAAVERDRKQPARNGHAADRLGRADLQSLRRACGIGAVPQAELQVGRAIHGLVGGLELALVREGLAEADRQGPEEKAQGHQSTKTRGGETGGQALHVHRCRLRIMFSKTATVARCDGGAGTGTPVLTERALAGRKKNFEIGYNRRNPSCL